jgi:hypothetical protein
MLDAMTEDPLPYGPENVNKAIRPFTKVVPFHRGEDNHKTWLPAWWWKRTDVSGEEKGLMAIIHSHANKQGDCYPTHPQLCQMAGIGHCKLERMLNQLRKKEEITWFNWRDKWGRNRCRYVLIGLRKRIYPTPTNEVVATPSKAGGKHIAIYNKGAERIEEGPEKYG